MKVAASGCAGELLQFLNDRFLRRHPNDLVAQLATAKEEQRGHTANTEPLLQSGIVIDVHFRHAEGCAYSTPRNRVQRASKKVGSSLRISNREAIRRRR